MDSWLLDLRHDLHRHPELAGNERATADRLRQTAETLRVSEILQGLGETGQAWIFEGQAPGPTLLLRADMDAVPVSDEGAHAHRSGIEGVSHACGHDGHMTILAGVGARFARRPPDRGRVVCLFQPAEENGAGADAVLRDPHFRSIRPDLAFAIHNLPGFALGGVIVRSGTCCCASRGLTITLRGTPAHAATPEQGRSPLRAMRRILEDLEGMAQGGEGLSRVTVVGARLGAKAFGTSPGDATIYATLRSGTDQDMLNLVRRVEAIAASYAYEDGLRHEIAYEDVFPATANSEPAVALVRQAAEGLMIIEPASAFPWSEDFGHFTARFGGALIGLGAGEETPPLHHPAYDFPDELIPYGIDLLWRIAVEP